MADLSHLSDEELDAQIAAAQAPKPSLSAMSDADLDRAIAAAAPPSAAAAGARQALSGFAGNFDDELSGAVSAAGRVAGVQNLGTWKPFNPDSHLQTSAPTLDPNELLKSYRDNRDVARHEQHKDIAAHPIISSVANTAGMIANPYIRAMGPAAAGAEQGLGNSEADLTKGDVLGATKDTAIGAGIGYLGGKLGDVASDYLAPKLGEIAENQSARAMGAERGTVKSLGADKVQAIGRYGLDNGIVTPLASTEDMLARNAAVQSNAGKAMGDVYGQIDQAGASTFNPLDTAVAVDNKIGDFWRSPINKGETNQLENTLNSILMRADQTGTNSIPLSAAQELKEELGKVANWKNTLNVTDKEQMARSAYGVVSDALDSAADSGSKTIGKDGLLKTLQDARATYSGSKGADTLLQNKQARELGNKMFGITDTIAAAGGAVFGPAGAVGVVATKKLAERYGAATSASTANFLSQVLEKNPQVLGKWAGPLANAAKRGQNALNASDYVLQQTDPAYRAKRAELNNSGGEDGQ